MAIWIDSAILEEVKEARRLGWVSGVTTNPLLLAKASLSPEQTLRSLSKLNIGPVFYQCIASNINILLAEARAAYEILGKHLVLKLCPNPESYQFVAGVSEEYACCITAVYSPAQALVAQAAGARYVAIYVNRATRLGGDGPKLVREVAQVLKNSPVEILAASIKSPEEAVSAMVAGAHHLTLPLEVLKALMHNEISARTSNDFLENGVGIPHA